MNKKNSMLNLLKDKRGDLDLRKIFFFIFVFGIFVGFVYLISAIPTLSTPVLNSTTVNNFSTENLTVYTDQDSNASLKLIYDWKVSGSSIISFNMPFDGDKLCEGNTTICDYGGTKLNMSTVGSATYNATGGRDGKGAYEMPGSAGSYVSSDPDEIDLSGNEITIMQWYKGTNYQVGFRQQHNAVNNWIILGHGATCVHRIRNNNANLEDTVSCTNSTGDSTIEDGEWHHIAFTWKRNTVNGMVSYVDGVQVDSTDASDMALPLVQEHVNLGAWNTEFGTGTWDEVMVFKRALSSEQIAYIYGLNGAQPNKIVSQETLGGEVWQVDVTPNDNTADGTTVSSNSFTIAGANIDSLVLNSTLGTNLSSENLTANPIGLAPSGSKIIYNWYENTLSTAIMNMPFDGGLLSDLFSSATKDYSGNGYYGEPTGGAAYNATGGYDGKGAFEFDGADDWINVNNGGAESDIPIISDFSVSAWVRRDTTGATDFIFASWEAALANQLMGLYFKADNTLSFTFFSNDLTTTTTFSADTWYHVVGTYDWGTRDRRIYVDGVLDSNDFSSADLDLNDPVETAIGKDVNGNFFDGVIDEVVVWNITLTAEQISALYNNRTDLIVSQETIYGDVWSVNATPNDNTADGITVSSGNLTIQSIGIGLSSTSGTNLTTENLTASVSGLITGDRVFHDWKVDGNSIMILNMPFDGGALAQGNLKVRDYSGNANNATAGSDTGAIQYNATGGYDGKGAYVFDGDDFIITGNIFTVGTNSISVSIWARNNNPGTGRDHMIAVGGNGNHISIYQDTTKEIGCGGQTITLESASTFSDTNWHHYACTYDSSTNSKVLYRDGAVIASGTASSDGSYSGTITIGRYATAIEHWNGSIDEVMVFNRSLSSGQVSALYNNRTDLIVMNETTYNDVWSVSVTPNNNIRDGDTVSSGNLTIPGIGISFSSSSGSNLNSDSLTASVSGLITGDKAIYNWEKDGSSIMLLNMPMDAGLLGGIYSSKNDITIKDYSTYGRNGTLGNDTVGNSAEPDYQSTGGFDGKGTYFFDGTDDWINMNPDIKTNATSFTISAWAKRLGFNQNNTIFSDGNAATANQQIYMGFNEDNKFVCGFYQNDLITSSDYTDNNWHYWVCTYNTQTNNRTIYLDGIPVASDISSADVVAGSETAIGKFTISGNPSPGIGQWFFNGFIDEVIFFDRDLSAEQISAIYNGGASSYRTNVIVDEETFYGDTWSMCATPIDGTSTADGDQVCSNNLAITSPAITLNSTLGTNTSDENLTAFVSGLSTSDKAIYNWKKGGNSIAVLNMPFDGGALLENETKIKDYSGYGNNGAVIGATYNATGGYDGKGAYDFDGVNDYINVIDTPSLSSIEDGGSFSLWVRSNVNLSAAGNNALLDSAPLVTGSIRLWDVGVNLNFGLGGGNEINWPFDSSWIDEWHYVVATWEKQVNITMTLYVDGEQKVQEMFPLQTTLVNLLDIGRVNNGDYWDGTIDELVVWNRTLTAQQVSALYNNRTDLIVSQETIFNETWQACATPNDNHFDGSEICSNNLTLVFVPITSITSNITPLAAINGTNVTIDFDVAGDEQSKSANLTHVNGTIITLTSFPFTFSNTGDIGIYNVTFYANDSSGNLINTTKAFTIALPVNVTINVDISIATGVSSLVIANVFVAGTNDVLSTTEINGSKSLLLPNVPVDVSFETSFDNDTSLTFLFNFNLSESVGGSINFGNIRVDPFLLTYGVTTNFSFTSAQVIVSYQNVSVTNENNLQFHKCDNYTVDTGTCISGFNDVTSDSSTVQDKDNNKFIYDTTSFSGFGIKEVTPSVPSAEEGAAGGGGGGCMVGYTFVVGEGCVKVAEEEIPAQLFDISLSLDDNLIQSSDELSVVVTFESFGFEPTPVNLTFIILDKSGSEIYRVEDSITVTTEEIMRKSFRGLDLPEGKYTLVLETLYNVDVSDEFRQDFEIGKERRGITGSIVGWVEGNGKWYLAGAVGLIIVVISIWLLVRAYKRKKDRL